MEPGQDGSGEGGREGGRRGTRRGDKEGCGRYSRCMAEKGSALQCISMGRQRKGKKSAEAAVSPRRLNFRTWGRIWRRLRSRRRRRRRAEHAEVGPDAPLPSPQPRPGQELSSGAHSPREQRLAAGQVQGMAGALVALSPAGRRGADRRSLLPACLPSVRPPRPSRRRSSVQLSSRRSGKSGSDRPGTPSPGSGCLCCSRFPRRRAKEASPAPPAPARLFPPPPLLRIFFYLGVFFCTRWGCACHELCLENGAATASVCLSKSGKPPSRSHPQPPHSTLSHTHTRGHTHLHPLPSRARPPPFRRAERWMTCQTKAIDSNTL